LLGNGGKVAFCHDIDGPYKRGGAVDASSRSLEHFYAEDVAQVAGQIEGVVGGLRVAEVDAIEQDGDLLLGAASDADVGLCTNGTALADIDAYGEFQQIVNTLYGSLLNVGTFQYSDHFRSLTLGQGRSRPGDTHFVEQ